MKKILFLLISMSVLETAYADDRLTNDELHLRDARCDQMQTKNGIKMQFHANIKTGAHSLLCFLPSMNCATLCEFGSENATTQLLVVSDSINI